MAVEERACSVKARAADDSDDGWTLEGRPRGASRKKGKDSPEAAKPVQAAVPSAEAVKEAVPSSAGDAPRKGIMKQRSEKSVAFDTRPQPPARKADPQPEPTLFHAQAGGASTS